MPIPLRRGLIDDAPACANIVNLWLENTPWIPPGPSEKEILKALTEGIPIREFWVAGDPVCGYLSFNTDTQTIAGLYTARPGEGIGKAMIDRVKQGRDYLQLWTHAANLNAHRFYRREGFVEVEQKAVGADGIPEIRMEWYRGDT